jgi:hypothetical protein
MVDIFKPPPVYLAYLNDSWLRWTNKYINKIDRVTIVQIWLPFFSNLIEILKKYRHDGIYLP